MNEMLRKFGASLALALLNAGGANALQRSRVEGAIPPNGRCRQSVTTGGGPGGGGAELKLGTPARGPDGVPRHAAAGARERAARRRRPGRGRFRSHFTATCRRSFRRPVGVARLAVVCTLVALIAIFVGYHSACGCSTRTTGRRTNPRSSHPTVETWPYGPRTNGRSSGHHREVQRGNERSSPELE